MATGMVFRLIFTTSCRCITISATVIMDKVSNSPSMPYTYIYMVGTNVPLAQSKPRLGLSAAVALMHTTLGTSRLCGNTSMLVNSKFLHDCSVLHSTTTASVCIRFGNPTSYQHG